MQNYTHYSLSSTTPHALVSEYAACYLSRKTLVAPAKKLHWLNCIVSSLSAILCSKAFTHAHLNKISSVPLSKLGNIIIYSFLLVGHSTETLLHALALISYFIFHK